MAASRLGGGVAGHAPPPWRAPSGPCRARGKKKKKKANVLARGVHRPHLSREDGEKAVTLWGFGSRRPSPPSGATGPPHAVPPTIAVGATRTVATAPTTACRRPAAAVQKAATTMRDATRRMKSAGMGRG